MTRATTKIKTKKHPQIAVENRGKAIQQSRQRLKAFMSNWRQHSHNWK